MLHRWIYLAMLVSVLTAASDADRWCRADDPVKRPTAKQAAQAGKRSPQPPGTVLSIRIPRSSPAEAAVGRALAKPAELRYEKRPLNKVADDLQATLRIPVLLDRKALAEAGIDADAPVTFAASNVSARSAIALMLRELELQAVATHGVLLITTPDEAVDVEEIWAYEVSDLVGTVSGPKGGPTVDLDQVIDTIVSCVRPTSWPTGGPRLGVFTAPGVSVIAFPQIEDVYDETEALLSQLRAVRHGPETVFKPIEPPIPDAEAAIRRALAKPVELDYKQIPLRRVAADLRTRLGVPVLLDNRALKDLGLSPEMPVTFAASHVPAKAAIELMLRPLPMAALIKNDLLLITSIEEADCSRTTRVYDVSDLIVDAGTSDKSRPNGDRLVESLETCVYPKSWSGDSGPGTIAPFKAKGIEAVVVCQTQRVHDEIDRVLSQLRAARHFETGPASPAPRKAAAQGPKTPGPVAIAGWRPSPIAQAETAVRRALSQPISVQLKDTSLSQVAAILQEKAGVPIVLDAKALEERSKPPAPKEKPAPGKRAKKDKDVGPSLNTPVTANIRDVALDSALYLILHPLRLTWTYDNECLLITTAENEEELLSTRCYDVADIVGLHGDRGGAGDYVDLIDILTTSIESSSWDNVGGAGSIDWFDAPGIHAIIVSQTWRTHLKIESMLAALRQFRGYRPTQSKE